MKCNNCLYTKKGHLEQIVYGREKKPATLKRVTEEFTKFEVLKV